MIYCSCILLTVCVLFFLTQIRSIHYKSAFYLFVTTVAALLMLAGQFTLALAESRVNGLFRLTVFLCASTMITQAALITVALFGVGYTFERTLSASIFLQMGSGLCCGATLGALIQRGFSLTGSRIAWMQWMQLLSLLLAITIALGEMSRQVKGFSGIRLRADIWDAASAEIIRMRDEGDPAVYTKLFKETIGINRSEAYKLNTLKWYELAFYELEYTLPKNLYAPKERSDS